MTACVDSYDPRLYQIASLGTLLTYGLLGLHFDVSALQIALTLGTALLVQYADTRLYRLRVFDPLSAIVSRSDSASFSAQTIPP